MAANTAGQTASSLVNGAPVLHAQGRIVFDATAITATDYVEVFPGFVPQKVVWENITDRIRIEWYAGMAANSCIKTAANGTRTLEVTGVNGGITVPATGTVTVGGVSQGPASVGSFRVLQNATLAAILASKTCTWEAWG